MIVIYFNLVCPPSFFRQLLILDCLFIFIRKGKCVPRAAVLNFNKYLVRGVLLLKVDLRARFQWSWFCKSGVGARICISSRFPSDAGTAGVETTLWEPLLWLLFSWRLPKIELFRYFHLGWSHSSKKHLPISCSGSQLCCQPFAG